MLTTLLDILGAFLVVAFAFFLWPPLALLVAGGFCLALSWALSRKPARDGDS